MVEAGSCVHLIGDVEQRLEVGFDVCFDGVERAEGIRLEFLVVRIFQKGDQPAGQVVWLHARNGAHVAVIWTSNVSHRLIVEPSVLYDTNDLRASMQPAWDTLPHHSPPVARQAARAATAQGMPRMRRAVTR